MLRRLARTADIIVESFMPGFLQSLDLDHAALVQDNPGLIIPSIIPFGQWGPYSGYKGSEISPTAAAAASIAARTEA